MHYGVDRQLAREQLQAVVLGNLLSIATGGSFDISRFSYLFLPVPEEPNPENSYTELTQEEMKRRWEEVFGPYEEFLAEWEKQKNASSDS